MNVLKPTVIISWLTEHLHKTYGIDVRSLALLRISVGLVVLLDLLQRFQHSSVFYSDAGVLPREDAFASLSPYRWSVLFANGTPEFMNLVFVVGFLAALAMIVGWRTRLATCVLWVVLMSLQSRNPHLSSGADTLIRVSLLWSILLPLGSVWSVDSYIAKPKDVGSEHTNISKRISTVATFGLILQVACVYLFTALQKDGSRWLDDGTALYYALGARDVSSDLGNWIFLNAPEVLLRSFTYGSLLIEFAIPMMLLLPLRTGWLRTAGVFLIVSLHLGIWMTMTVGLFPAISIASAVGLLPTWFWENVVNRIPVGSAVDRIKEKIAGASWPILQRWPTMHPGTTTQNTGTGNLASSASGDDYLLHFIQSPRNNRPALAAMLANVGAALAILLVLAWNVQTVSSYQPPQSVRQAAISTGLYQNWSMFAPNPQNASIWFVVEGELESGEKIDLLIPIYEGDVSMRQPVVWDQSNDIVLKDKYWRKYFHAIRGSDSDSQKFAAYTCRTWNAENTGVERLSTITLTRGVSSTRLDGMRDAPKYDQLESWNCT